MALRDYNELIVARLEEFSDALQQRDAEPARDCLKHLRSEGFAGADLARALEELEGDEPDWDFLVEWGRERLEELAPAGDISEAALDAFEFDIDDAFLEMEDSGVRIPEAVPDEVDLLAGLDLDSSSAVELVDEVSFAVTDDDAEDIVPEATGNTTPFNPGAAAVERADPLTVEAEVSETDLLTSDSEPEAKPSVSGKFKLPTPGPARAEGGDKDKKTTRPNVSVTSRQTRPNVSARRLGGGGGGGPPEDLESPDISDDFDFDLGFTNPETGSKPEPGAVPDSFEFDIDSITPPGRDNDLAETRQAPAVRKAATEDDFFELAESMAAPGEIPYRGEPRAPTNAAATYDASSGANPFAQDAPTGTAVPALTGLHARAEPATNLDAILLEVRRLKDQGEYGAALDIARKVLSRGASDEASDLHDELEALVAAEKAAVISDMTLVPTLAVDLGEIASRTLDHRAGFLLSQVDGTYTIEDLIEVSGMGRDDTLAVLGGLVADGIVVLK